MTSPGSAAAVKPFEMGALLGIVEQSGHGIAILIEGLQREDLLRSRLTRAEVQRLLRQMGGSLSALGPSARSAMPELDWDGWRALAPQLARRSGEALDEALWFACESLVPATLLWLRVYRQGQPELFRMSLPW